MGILSIQSRYLSYTNLPLPPHTKTEPQSFRCSCIGPTASTSSSSSSLRCEHNKDKVIVIMGATGCGKSSLAVELASRVEQPAEIVNSDKMQVYNGLEITTNKISMHDRNGIPHHLIGAVDSSHHPDFTAENFRLVAGTVISDLSSNGKLPIIAGGSNSFVQALLADKYDQGFDPLVSGLRYDCCFLWVDLAFPTLCKYLCERVDDMLLLGMFEELSEFFAGDISPGLQPGVGIMKAIGVPEFEVFFKKYPSDGRPMSKWDSERRLAFAQSERRIKTNTCLLAGRQLEKIERLREVAGWRLHRVDATKAVEMKMLKDEKWVGAWGDEVVKPSMDFVKKFLMNC